MYRLSSIILFLFVFVRTYAQSPHGELFKIDCAQCHNASGWAVNTDSIKYDHDLAAFKLSGVHSKADCKSCHIASIFSEAPSQCSSCHTDVHNMTVGNDCSRCHTTNDWLVDNIPELHEENGFAMVGAHSNLMCIDCHTSETNLIFNRIGNECINCHTNDFNSAKNPDHVSGGFSTNCIDCHDPIADNWNSSNFNHDFFPLTLGHAIFDCKACHHTNNFSDASGLCSSCHMQDYNSAINPNHAVENISTSCTDCHTTGAWTPSTFDHSIFPFAGSHLPIANNCNQCHNGNYANTPNTCNGCHMPEFTATTNPNHSAAQFPTDCAVCHDETAWVPSSYNHNTIFPLLGAHAAVTNCNDCHHNNYTSTPNTCSGCHMPDYTAAVNPNHSTAQFPTDCAICHDETAWIPSSFTHNLFPLLGAHATISNCNDCHHGNYTSTPNTCNGCHMPDYTATTNPNHTAAQFSTDCAVCHNESAWTPATYNHSNFPLVGAHASITNCNLCHNGNYTNTPNTCAGCHMPDYNATTNPNHSASGFSTNCATCHNESGWTPSSYDHDAMFFPIYSGKHNGEWNACTDCHTNAGNFAIFSCIDCHEHNNQNSVNNDHNGVSGYSYNSNACFNCHPDGSE